MNFPQWLTNDHLEHPTHPVGGLTLCFLVKARREVHLARPPDQGAVAALTFASPGLLCRYLRAESNGTPGPALGSQAHNGAAA